MLVKCKDYNLFLSGFDAKERFISFTGNKEEACKLDSEQVSSFEEFYGNEMGFEYLHVKEEVRIVEPCLV